MATPPVPAEETARRVAAIRTAIAAGYAPPGQGGGKGSSTVEAARMLGMGVGALQGTVRALGPGYEWASVPVAPVAPPAAEGREKTRLADEVSRLRGELRAAHRAEIDATQVREAIFGLAAKTPSPPEWLLSSAPGGSAPGVPVLMWSDWHLGEVVKPEEVGGVNAFNKDIARERVRRLVDNTIDLCFNHMVNPEYPGAVVVLGGDMITGTIHDELAESNDLQTGPAIMEAADLLCWALGQMADAFGRIFVPCVVGNHGRMTAKPRAKGRVHTSYEFILYCQLERHFRGDERVQFMIPGEADCHFRVFAHRFMLTHGDALGVKGGDGIIGSLGPITRGRIKTRDSEAQVGRDFDTLLIGHWHQYLPLPGLIVNGCLKGYDEYARLYLRAKYQRAIQALFFVHPKQGVTCHWPVYVDEAPARPGGKEWVSWQE